MARSVKKGPFVDAHLMHKVDARRKGLGIGTLHQLFEIRLKHIAKQGQVTDFRKIA